ncbi:chemotaxis protein CheW [Methanocella sp. MCL-LM]|uniref:chemotaxis protein CheW n=1 Tax=Methanocella sp. MCL-LM TaxID=3412035 RepID=UPI003C723738
MEAPLKAAMPATASASQEILADELQVVEFQLAEEIYAINLFHVKEIVQYTKVTRLPNSPGHILGIVDLRGEICTIFDIKNKLNLGDNGQLNAENAKVIVLDDKIIGYKLGILVDNVLNVTSVAKDQIDQSQSSRDYDSSILGIIKKPLRVDGKESCELVILVDIKKIVGDATI